jgi:hypothetical protein
MRKALLWFGALLSGIGIAVVVASAVMNHRGLNASFNLGDPSKFEFVLIPFWQVGLAIAGAGVACLLASRRLRKNADTSAAP